MKEVDVEEEQEIPFSEKSILGKIMYILEFPFMIVAFITIPPVETEKLASPFVVLYSLTSPLAFIFLKGSKSLSFYTPKFHTDSHQFSVHKRISRIKLHLLDSHLRSSTHDNQLNYLQNWK
jgi:hypothetical protein